MKFSSKPPIDYKLRIKYLQEELKKNNDKYAELNYKHQELKKEYIKLFNLYFG